MKMNNINWYYDGLGERFGYQQLCTDNNCLFVDCSLRFDSTTNSFQRKKSFNENLSLLQNWVTVNIKFILKYFL